MTKVNPNERQDVGAALLTMAAISSSYKVESTKAITSMWDELRMYIAIDDDIDFISVILGVGRIGDLQADFINVDEIQSVVTSFRKRLDEQGITEGGVAEQGAAYLTTSVISHSEEVETTSTVILLWNEIIKHVPMKDDLDLAAAILATGRIMDLRIDVKSMEVLSEIVESIRAELETRDITKVDYKELAMLLLGASIVELSPKVEKYRDIVNSWAELKEKITISDNKDIVAVILFSGKIRDMDTSMLIYPSSITDQISVIRQALDEM
jgi:hypothetical protein